MKKEKYLKLSRAMTLIICLWFVLIGFTVLAYGKDEKPGLFIGVGGGFGTVTEPEYRGKISDRGTNLKFQVGLGLRSGALFMIEYEVHHIKEERPEECFKLFFDRITSIMNAKTSIKLNNCLSFQLLT